MSEHKDALAFAGAAATLVGDIWRDKYHSMMAEKNAEIEKLNAELEEAKEIIEARKAQVKAFEQHSNDLQRQLDSFKESTESDRLRINALTEDQSSWSLKAIEQFNRAEDLERQLAEARAENEKIGSVLGLHEYTKRIRKEAARECYNLVNIFATPDIVFVLDAIKAKFGLEG